MQPKSLIALCGASLLTLATVALEAETAPRVLGTFTEERLGGLPTRLCWSADSTEVYIETTRREDGKSQQRHFLLSLAHGSSLQAIPTAPGWSGEYWLWKTARYRPEDPSLGIDVETTSPRMSPGPEPMAGGLSRWALMNGRVGSDAEEVIDAVRFGEMLTIFQLKLKGIVIGEATNRQSVGLTFTWLPHGSGVLAFTDSKGRLKRIREDGGVEQVLKTKNALLPAASLDGNWIAYFEPVKGDKFRLSVLRLKR